MSGPVTLDALDLAALLCSRVCHDLISPVGAIVNGLEVLEVIAESSARLLINRAGYQTKREEVRGLIQSLEKAVQ